MRMQRMPLDERVQQHLRRHVAPLALLHVAEQLLQRRHLALRHKQVLLLLRCCFNFAPYGHALLPEPGLSMQRRQSENISKVKILQHVLNTMLQRTCKERLQR